MERHKERAKMPMFVYTEDEVIDLQAKSEADGARRALELLEKLQKDLFDIQHIFIHANEFDWKHLDEVLSKSPNTVYWRRIMKELEKQLKNIT
jgi:hypothetical protein